MGAPEDGAGNVPVMHVGSARALGDSMQQMKKRAALIAVVGGVLMGVGCEEKRNLPQGFLAEAAKEAPAASNSGGAEASGAAAAPMGPNSGPNGFRAAASAPDMSAAGPTSETPEADEATAAAMVETLAAELKLPPIAEVAVAPGEEEFQKAARSSKYDTFRSMSVRYVQLRAELLPYGKKLADGSATPEERRIHNRIEEAMGVEFRRLNRYMWDSRWDDKDRAAMGWILYGAQQPK
jgi:hypothetical protein